MMPLQRYHYLALRLALVLGFGIRKSDQRYRFRLPAAGYLGTIIPESRPPWIVT